MDTFCPGASSSGVMVFCLFILLRGFSWQEHWSGLPFPSPVNHILSELSTMTCSSWVALHGMALSFIELCKPLCHDKAVIHEINYTSVLKQKGKKNFKIKKKNKRKKGLGLVVSWPRIPRAQAQLQVWFDSRFQWCRNSACSFFHLKSLPSFSLASLPGPNLHGQKPSDFSTVTRWQPSVLSSPPLRAKAFCQPRLQVLKPTVIGLNQVMCSFLTQSLHPGYNQWKL